MILLDVIILQELNCWHDATKGTAAEHKKHVKSHRAINHQQKVITCLLMFLFFWTPKGTYGSVAP